MTAIIEDVNIRVFTSQVRSTEITAVMGWRRGQDTKRPGTNSVPIQTDITKLGQICCRR